MDQDSFHSDDEDLTASVHDRMPVILAPDKYDLWLDPALTNVNVISELLKPYDARLMWCYPVSTRINRVENDDEECCRPDWHTQVQEGLFQQQSDFFQFDQNRRARTQKSLSRAVSLGRRVSPLEYTELLPKCEVLHEQVLP